MGKYAEEVADGLCHLFTNNSMVVSRILEKFELVGTGWGNYYYLVHDPGRDERSRIGNYMKELETQCQPMYV